MNKIYIFLLLSLIPHFLFSQSNDYHHFQGKLGENMFINANLQTVNGELFGSYYYKIKSKQEILSESLLILLEGKVRKNQYSFSEKENKESFFEGIFSNELKTLDGNWSTAGRKIPFHWDEKYKSSALLSTIEINRFLPLKKGQEEPKGTFSSTLFYPNKSNPKLYKAYIQFIKRMFETDTSINDLFKLIAIYKDDFFDRYYKNNIGKYTNGERKGLNWSQRLNNKIYFNDKNILSIYFTKYINTGGSVDLEMVYTANFYLPMNKEIGLDDIFTSNYQSILQQQLAQQLRADFMIEEQQSFTDIGFFTNDIPLATNYLLTNNGIIFFYNVYELAGNSFGKIEVFLEYESLSSILKMKNLLSK